MFEDFSNQNKLVIGTKQALKAVKEGKAQTVFIAKDAERHVTRGVEEAARNQNLKIVYVESMKKLGKDCGIEVGAATIVILK